MSAGAVSAALERRLLADLKAKSLCVWLDTEGTFTPFVDALAARGDFGAPIARFRGSFLELMLAFREGSSTLSKPVMLVHLPGFNTDTVRSTPLLEVYEAGYRVQLRLDTLVRETANGRYPLSEIERFVTGPGLTLETADAWLARADGGGGGNADWVEQLDASAFLTHLASPASLSSAEVRAANRRRAETLFGTSKAWLDAWGDSAEREVRAIQAWVLCVEYANDLKEPPKRADLVPLRALPKATVARCQAECVRLREDLPEPYRELANDVEAWLGPEETQLDPRVLGHVDTFRFEALSIYRGAVSALDQGDYAQVKKWADAHEASEGFWVHQEQPRRWAWILVAAGARLGLALTKAERPLQHARTLEEAVLAYVDHAAAVDRALRDFEQLHELHYGVLLPEQYALGVAFEKLRFKYDDWAKALAREFNDLCRKHGALPPPELQQRQLFEDVVTPLLRGNERTALFVLDALRFEMALELRDELKAAGLELELKPRLAELPTITAVGMNVLAPVARDGRLTPVLKAGRFEGFKAGETTVARPDDRVKAMALRTPKPPKQLTVAEVRGATAERLKNQVSQCQLLVVHGKELDDAGESGFGLDEFGKVLRDVLLARDQLEKAGVTQFVFTADHGFLLGRSRGSHAWGSRGEAQRRYVLSQEERSDSGYLAVPLASLGYEGTRTLLFRDDTDEFRVGSGVSGNFVHGGNSLQERVIPVLKAWRKRAVAEVRVQYALACEWVAPVMGVQRARVRAQTVGQTSLGFSAGNVDVALAVPGRADVRVVVKDVSGGGASMHGGALRLDAGRAEWAEVFFVLHGSGEERVPVEVSLLSDPSCSARPEGLFAVVYDAAVPAAVAPAPVASGWTERLGDPDAGKVFDHLERHGALNEPDLVQLLGSSRKARAFAARLEGFLERVTFEVEVVTGESGKQYRKR